MLKKNNYAPVDQCSKNWKAIRIGVITTSKTPALLGFCGLKEFDNAWFAIKNKIDEYIESKKSRAAKFHKR